MSFIKVILICTGLLVYSYVGYFLYNKDLGAIPLIILSFWLFYISYRIMVPHKFRIRRKKIKVKMANKKKE
ncbi:MAG: hypothetical protein E7150_10720 [Bacillus sp. (in: Bacteria)]|nr:hypothetical protein [Bacillus sp. (in: firmicutes)]